MAVQFLLFSVLLVLIKESQSGILNPLDIAGNIAGNIEKGTKSLVNDVTNGVKNVVDDVVDDTKTIAGKVHNGVFEIENGIINSLDEVIGTPVTLNEVTFSLTTENNVDKPKKIDFYKPDEVATKTGKIFFLTHGWNADGNSSWFFDLSEIFARKYPGSHVVHVDWHKPASDNYAFSAFQTETVGNFLGILATRLVTDYKVPRENIVLIGHSLGGQISGWAGKKFRELTGQTLPRIVALDPAGPLFIHRPDSRRLNKDDAEVVMVIHSDGGKLGFPFSCGTIDFYPNGGSSQPGCWEINLAKISTYADPVTCDHSRAWQFFVEAEDSDGSFMAKKCPSYKAFKKNKKCENVEVAMGDLETKETGDFYLQTNDEEPYSKSLSNVTNDDDRDESSEEEN